MKNEDLRGDILNLDVLCRGNRMHLFDDAYFPRKDLEDQAAKYLTEREFFPWLKIDTRSTGRSYPSAWTRLIKALELDGENTSPVAFSLAVVYAMQEANPLAKDMIPPDRVYHLYEHIYSSCHDDPDREEWLDRIRYVTSPFSTY